MKNDKDENKLFIEACHKAGLKVQTKASNQVAEGLIVRDSQGRKYTVDSEAQLKAVSQIDSIGLIHTQKFLTNNANPTVKPARRLRNREKAMRARMVLKKQED